MLAACMAAAAVEAARLLVTRGQELREGKPKELGRKPLLAQPQGVKDRQPLAAQPWKVQAGWLLAAQPKGMEQLAARSPLSRAAKGTGRFLRP